MRASFIGFVFKGLGDTYGEIWLRVHQDARVIASVRPSKVAPHLFSSENRLDRRADFVNPPDALDASSRKTGEREDWLRGPECTETCKIGRIGGCLRRKHIYRTETCECESMRFSKMRMIWLLSAPWLANPTRMASTDAPGMALRNDSTPRMKSRLS